MTREVQVHCPHCGHQASIRAFNGNTVDMPLVCVACGRPFTPRYYCPDRKATNRHAFEVQTLYVDSLGDIYTFCPQHTFTTYDMVESLPGHGWQAALRFAHRLLDSLDTVRFRLGLAVEGTRQRLLRYLAPHWKTKERS